MKILITGGAGFIGSHLTQELLGKGHEVIVLDNLRNGSKENLKSVSSSEGFSFIKGDILNKEDCHKAAQNADIIYHLACLGVRHSIHSPFENHRVNAEGTLNVLDAARQNGVKKVFYISTSEVYGKTNAFPIKEESPAFPVTVYGASKLAGEHYTRSFYEYYGMDVVVLRVFNNYGPRAHYEGDAGEVIPRTIVNILKENPPVIFGEGSVTRDFFYVKDTASILTQLAEVKGLTGQTFNLGTGTEISIRELIEKILELMDSDIKIRYLPPRPADVPRLWVDSSKLKNYFDYIPAFSFEQGLRNTIDYYKKLNEEGKLNKEIPEMNWGN